MIWPVDASVSQEYGSNPTQHLPADSWLIQTFGNYQPNGHTGVDFPVQIGTPVKAVANGTVKHAGWYSGSYLDNPYWISPSFAGFCLVIDHGAFVGIYAHLSGASVAAGETVREGQVVAHSGNTGGSTGPHLHFEVLPDGWDFNNGMYGRVNPAQFIRGAAAIAPQGETITPEVPKEWDEMASKQDIKEVVAEALWAVLEGPRGETAIQQAVWGFDGGKRNGKQVSIWRDAVDANTLGRQLLVEVATLKEIVRAQAANPGKVIDYDEIQRRMEAGFDARVESVVQKQEVTTTEINLKKEAA